MKKSLIFKGLLVFMAALMFVACKDDEPIPDANKAEFEVVEYEDSKEDRLTVTSSLPAYVTPYSYTNFGKSFVDRMVNRVPSLNFENLIDIETIVLHSSQIEQVLLFPPLLIPCIHIQQLQSQRNRRNYLM